MRNAAISVLLFVFAVTLVLALCEVIIYRGDSWSILRGALIVFALLVLAAGRRAPSDLALTAGLCISAFFIENAAGKVAAAVCVIALTALPARAKGKRGLISLPFLLVFGCIILFNTAAALDLQEIYFLSGEDTAMLHLGDLIGIAMLFVLANAAWSRTFRLRAETFLARLFSAAAAAVCVAMIFIRTGGARASVDIFPGEQAPLVLALVLLGARIFLPLPGAYEKGSPWGSRTALAVFLAPFVLIGASAAYNLSLMQKPLTDEPITPYRVSEYFLLPLFTSEDNRFMRHAGVDYHRFRQVLKETLEKRELGKGGSTITMQLAKIRYLGHQKTFLRKLNQIVLALMLELRHSKREILFAYLESVPFAPGINGLRNAARQFFSVDPARLTRDEALPLVLSIYNPLDYNVSMDPAANTIRARRAVIEARAKKFRPVLLSDIEPLSVVERVN